MAGRLEFSEANGATVKLFGAFGGLRSFARYATDDMRSSPSRIVGVAANKLVTLDACYLESSTFSAPGGPQQTYRATRVIEGVHFDHDESLDFDAVHLSIEALNEFVLNNALEYSISHDEAQDRFTEIQLTLRPPNT